MAMFFGYFDASGTHRGSQAVSVASYIARDTHWERFELGWKKVLRRFGVRCFHMTDWESLQGEFQGWDTEKKHDLFTQLVKIIRANITFGICATVTLGDYPFGQVSGMPSPFVACAVSCLIMLEERMKRLAPTARLSLVFEHGDGYGPELAKYFSVVREKESWSEVIRNIALGFADKRLLVPLQAADIFAYEEYKEMCNYGVAGTGTRAVRVTRSMLIKGQESRYNVFPISRDFLITTGEGRPRLVKIVPKRPL